MSSRKKAHCWTCAELTGLRVETISELMTGNKAAINLHHIVVLMLCLNILPRFLKKAVKNQKCTKIIEDKIENRINKPNMQTIIGEIKDVYDV